MSINFKTNSLRQPPPRTRANDRDQPTDAPCFDERQLLEDTRGYLQALSRSSKPARRHRQAWERFFQVHSRRIRSEARDRGLAGQDADDCLQEVWIAILDALNCPDEDRPWLRFSCWIRGLIRNQVVSFVRKQLGAESDRPPRCQLPFRMRTRTRRPFTSESRTDA